MGGQLRSSGSMWRGGLCGGMDKVLGSRRDVLRGGLFRVWFAGWLGLRCRLRIVELGEREGGYWWEPGVCVGEST